MKILRITEYVLGGIVIAALLAILTAMWIYRDIPAAQLEAKYSGPTSKFINIDGVRIHYRDEGPRDAPTVVLVHANFASLIGWDPWVEALKDSYHVICFDMTSHGLTGTDPSGDYGLERTIELAERFIDALGLDVFTIGGTSLGGTVAIHYSVRQPDRVDKLILLSPGALEGLARKAGPRGEVPRAAYILKYIMPRAVPEYMLRSGYGNPENLPAELVDRWYDLWMREGQREAQLDRLSQYQSGDIKAVIRQVRAPVLLLWGEANTTAKFEQAAEVMALLENAERVDFISYPGVGHMAVQEAGEQTGQDVRAFLDGTLITESVVDDADTGSGEAADPPAGG